MNFSSQLFRVTKVCCYVRNNLIINIYPAVLYQYKHVNTTSTTQIKYFSIHHANLNKKENKKKEGPLKKLMSKIPFLDISKSKLKVTGYYLYESVADKISYSDFFVQLSLPDTFYSWFVITELHVWMLLVRVMQEGENGRYTRNCIVQAMWADVNTRVKKLGAANPSGIRMQVDELSQQFQAVLVGYDEGLLSNDKVLASALWRRFFQQQNINPEHLETLVHYVRKQIKILDDISTEDLLDKRQIQWTKLNFI